MGSGDELRANSKLTSNDYSMPVLGLIFLRYAHNRFLLIEKELLKDRPTRNGVAMPVTPEDFKQKSALYLPQEARFDYLINLPRDKDLGQALNTAVEQIEAQSNQLAGVLPKNYNPFDNTLLKGILRMIRLLLKSMQSVYMITSIILIRRLILLSFQ